MKTTNPHCAALGIQVPRLEAAKDSAEANHYSLLLVALLERGEPMTLEDAASSACDRPNRSGWFDRIRARSLRPMNR